MDCRIGSVTDLWGIRLPLVEEGAPMIVAVSCQASVNPSELVYIVSLLLQLVRFYIWALCRSRRQSFLRSFLLNLDRWLSVPYVEVG